MNKAEREAILSKWIRPSSDTEQARQDRAERMIRDAISRHTGFANASYEVYAKGSYANNTNVRLDSDVDIVVECHECFYSDPAPGVTLLPSSSPSYSGIWTPAQWRSEVLAALVAGFGAAAIDSTGNIAINVAEQGNSRVTADVVPSFDYKRYLSSDRSRWDEGSVVFSKALTKTINWPKQQLDNGIEKNNATGRRYKSFVRALKNAENELVVQKKLAPKPSYLMECLVWNVPNMTLASADLDGGFRSTLVWLWQNLTQSYVRENWLEPNGIKYLFGNHQKWTVEDAKEVVQKTWTRLGYSE